MKVTVIYGTDNGNRQNAALQIASQLGGKVFDITAVAIFDFEDCDLLILNTPTYGFGDLQGDWDVHLTLFKEVSLSGKKVALFGLGDQAFYSDSLVDALGLLYDAVTEEGATGVGAASSNGYESNESRAVRNGRFVGHVLDEDNQPTESEQRIASWVA